MDTLKQQLEIELEQTRQNVHNLLDIIPQALYGVPSKNHAWTVGDVLYHITLGPRALSFEAALIQYFRAPYQFTMNHFPSKAFNWINARFAHSSKPRSKETLAKQYESSHAVMLFRLKHTPPQDLTRSVIYPDEFVSELKGLVTIERLFRYTKLHYELHAEQIKKVL